MVVLRALGRIFPIVGLVLVGLALLPDFQYLATRHATGCGFLHGDCTFEQTQARDMKLFIGGLLFAIGFVYSAVDRLVTGATQHRQQLLRTGKAGVGTVLDVQDTGITVNDDPRVRITLRIEADGEAPFEVRKAMTVSRVDVPRVGEVRDVRFDPANHDDWTFAAAQAFAVAQDAANVKTVQLHSTLQTAAPLANAAAAIAFFSAFSPLAGSAIAALRTAAADPSFKERLRQAQTPEEAREILRSVLGDSANAMQIGLAHRDALLGAAAAPADPIAQLERLTTLRDRGALSADEFEAQKRKLLGEQ